MSGLTSADGTDTDRPSRSASRTGDTDRGVSELLGAILLFGLLVAVMVLLQANAVPSQNERIEFDHNQRVQADVLELSSAAEDVAATGRDRSRVVELAPEYPNRFLLLNPGRAQGRLATTEADFTIDNAVADGETGDYWNGDARRFDANALEYVPSYNVYRNAPDTKLAHGTVTDRFPDGTVTAIGGGSFVDGRRISLVALDGQRSEARGGALSVELVPLSTETETVTVTNDSDGPLVIELDTDRTTDQWKRILADELSDGFVTEVREGSGDAVEVVFETDETYQLRLSKVGVGGGVSDPEPTYLTAHGNSAPTVEPGADRELTVQVRDGFNAPEPGIEVTFARTGGGSLDGTTVVTDEDGEATVTYTAGSTDGTVVATIDDGTGDAGDPKSVRYDVTAQSGAGSAGPMNSTELINPRGAVVLNGSDYVGSGTIRMNFTNQLNRSKTISKARVNAVIGGKPGDQSNTFYARLSGTDGDYPTRPEMRVTGPLVSGQDLPIPVSSTDDTTLYLRLYEGSGTGSPWNPTGATDVTIIVSFVYEDGTTGTYFAGASGGGGNGRGGGP